MMMYSLSANKMKIEKKTAQFITCGFTGILKRWWDHYIAPEQKIERFNVIKIANNTQVQDALYTLMLTLLEHLQGELLIKESALELM